MGQQQLLLVILVTIIVGIATVVAINIFGTAAEQANKDAIRQDLLSAAAQAQGLYTRPVMMGGTGGDFTTFTNPQLAERLGIPADNIAGNIVNNQNGAYTVTGAADVLTISVAPSGSDGTWTMTVTNDDGVWRTSVTDGDGLVSEMNPAAASE